MQEKIREVLGKHLSEDAFTPELIEDLVGLEGGNTETPDVEKAVEEALEQNNKDWNERYRKTFFGETQEGEGEETQQKLEPITLQEEDPADDPLLNPTFDDIFVTEG